MASFSSFYDGSVGWSIGHCCFPSTGLSSEWAVEWKYFWIAIKYIAPLLIAHSVTADGDNLYNGSALLIIDVQDCFLKGGSMAVEGGENVIKVVNSIRSKWQNYFNMTVLTKDWHCPGHVSFASAHPGHKPYDSIVLNYTSEGKLCSYNVNISNTVNCTDDMVAREVTQTLWPDHCVANITSGPTSSNINKGLITYENDTYILKGGKCQIDSYSAFWDNGHMSETNLHSILTIKYIKNLFIVGLALDYCVMETARDAKNLSFNTYVVRDATMPVSKETGLKALITLQEIGVNVLNSTEIDVLLTKTRSHNREHKTNADVLLQLGLLFIIMFVDGN